MTANALSPYIYPQVTLQYVGERSVILDHDTRLIYVSPRGTIYTGRLIMMNDSNKETWRVDDTNPTGTIHGGMSVTLTFRTPANSLFATSTNTYAVYITANGIDRFGNTINQRIFLGHVTVTAWDTFWRLGKLDHDHDDD